MFTRNTVLLVSALVATAVPVLGAESPELGTPMTAADLAAWDISIQPDGTGLPAGSGNAVTGKSLYIEKCQVCHNQDGTGQPADRLAGGQGSLATNAPVKTVGSYWPYATTVFDYIRRAMPLTAPQSLTNDEVYALTAYLLSVNGIVKERTVMNAKTLAAVRMPNRDGFILKYPDKPR
jgi:S-disulfanyl-L-cysteine oxidoreductase SoxD